MGNEPVLDALAMSCIFSSTEVEVERVNDPSATEGIVSFHTLCTLYVRLNMRSAGSYHYF